MGILAKAETLREIAEELDLHGLYFQHAALCRRRAWLHLAGATHVVRNARAQRGLALHDTERTRGHVPRGLGIAPDDIDFERRLVIERKGGPGAPRAVARQALFYAAYMTGATGELWGAEVQVYGGRGCTIYSLTEFVLDELLAAARQALALLRGPAPRARRIPLCRQCSCYGLCWDEVDVES